MGKEIGIDLGTTNTVVSYVNKKGKLRQLRYEQNEVIPSVVYFTSEKEFEIGEKAKKKLLYNPEAGVANFKSYMGDRQRHEVIAENGERFKYRAKKIAEIFLNRIIATIEAQLIKEFGPVEGCIGKVVITVPAKFNDAEKEATKEAALGAGFEDVKLATEPTAAAVAHKQDYELDGRIVLVYDFGGGTFDVSVIQEKGERFVEMATGGDKTLGGNKLTRKLAEHFFHLIEDEYAVELPMDKDEFDEDYCGLTKLDYLRNHSAIYEEAERTKEALADEENYDASINIILPGGGNEIWECHVTREKFNDLIRADVERTIEITRNVIEEARERGAEEINKIVLAGGSSQLPLVKELMEENFKSSNPVYADDVSTLISRGAAILAHEVLDDVTEPITNVQYGIAVTDGISYRKFQTLIAENQKLPCEGRETFYLNRDGQNRIEIPYYERDIKNYPEAKRTDDEGITEIDTIVISGLPENLLKDEVKIEVKFMMLRDGTLEIQVDIVDRQGNSIRNKSVEWERGSNLE